MRSSLSAQAWRVTAGSEAAETMYPRPTGRDSSCEAVARLPASSGLGARLGGMSNVSELPSGTVKISRAQDAEWLRPKWYRGRLLRLLSRSTRTHMTVGVLAGTNPPVSSMGNTVNPMSRFRPGAGALARGAVEIAGTGSWRKRRPLCNGADRCGEVAPPRKRAHFQPVVRDERDCRTALGGDCK